MKKLLTILLVFVVCITLTACNSKEEVKPENIGMPNPVVEYNSLAEIIDITGVNLIRPGVMGIANERFSIIDDEIAQYDFELNGNSWTIRGAKNVVDDISGIHDEHNIFISGQDHTLYTNDFYLERFFDGDTQYSIVVKNPITKDGEEVVSEETFMNCCMEIESILKQHSDDPLVGEYADITSKRAMLIVERTGDIYHLYVEWASSANEVTIWMMEAKHEEDKLTYAGEIISHYTYDADGNETKEETASNNLGYFEICDGQLHWTGAGQEECRNCIFEKMVYEE